MDDQRRIRGLLLEQLTGQNAHVDFKQAVEGLSFEEIGIRPPDMPHSIWELVEHIRIAQYDIVDFSTNSNYKQPAWPDDYWPDYQKPADEKQWSDTLSGVRKDHQAMVDIVSNSDNDLLSPIPHGNGQTLFREAMLIVDHNAYHIGQIVQVRRALDNW